MPYRTNDLFDFSESQIMHLSISIPILSGILAYGFNIPLAHFVFYCSLMYWVILILGLTFISALEIITYPYVYLGLATILLAVVFKTHLLGIAIILALVVIFTKMIQQKNNKFKEKQREPSIFRENNYDAIKLYSEVTPLNEIDTNTFRNTSTYKKVQEAYNKKTIKQYASY